MRKDISLIKHKILLPLGSLYLFLIILFFSSIYFIDLKKQEKTSIEQQEHIEHSFLRNTDIKAAQESVLINIIEKNGCVINALQAENRHLLFSCISSLYDIVEDSLLVSNINIITSDGKYFFRFGKSGESSQNINNKPNGFVINRAMNTHSLSYGLEVSKEKKIKLVIAQNILLPSGKHFFIEIKTEIFDITDAIEEVENTLLLLLVENEYIQKLYPKASLSPEFADYQLVYGDASLLNDNIKSIYGEHSNNEIKTSLQYKLKGNYYRSGKLPLLDEGGNYFGHIIYVNNETVAINVLYSFYLYSLLITIIISLILFFVINYYLNLIEGQLSTSYQSLSNEIDERKIAENKITEHHTFLQAIIDSIDDNIMVINSNYQIELMNHTARKTINHKFIRDPENPKCYELSHHISSPCDGKDYPCPLNKVFKTQQTCKVIHNHPSLEGQEQFFELVATPLFNAQNEIYAIVESGRDLTEHLSIQNKLQQQKNTLSYQATHDALTRLPNRVLFIDRLEQSIKKATRFKSKVAILFIDLDRFKEINDSLGHSIGDLVLIEVANRLVNSVRSFDTIARLGGDEFTLIMENIHIDDVNNISSKILHNLQKKMRLNGHELYITSSIGISIYPEDGLSSETLLKNADAAMYKAKENGKNNYQFYTVDMTKKSLDHVLMETSLRQALEKNEFIVYYQPQVNASTNKIIGMEALVRWAPQDTKMIPPNEFIPLAVKTGIINSIDAWVFKTTCENLVKWHKIGLNPGRIAVNMSVKELYKKDFLQRIQEVLQSTGCLAQWLELEITEDYLMQEPEKSAKILSQIKNLGIHLAIDDFGTGYSSLSYLKSLPINKLKIDRSFIRDIPDDSDDKAITRTIISLAKNMNLDILAEGVETIAQRDFLLQNGCTTIQGYLYAKPMPANELEKLLKQEILLPSC